MKLFWKIIIALAICWVLFGLYQNIRHPADYSNTTDGNCDSYSGC